jgi:signal transduction histidine kinase
MLRLESDLGEVRAVIRHYRPEDLEDLESLIFLGRQERESTGPTDTA